MSTSHDHLNQSAPAEPAGMNLQTDEAKATAAEITADNAALEEAYQSIEADAEATAEKAHQLDELAAEVLEEIQEGHLEELQDGHTSA
jgi:hypothetical protein